MFAGNYIHTGDFDDIEYGFIYKDGAFTALPYAGLDIVTITGLNRTGVAVGTIQMPNNITLGQRDVPRKVER